MAFVREVFEQVRSRRTQSGCAAPRGRSRGIKARIVPRPPPGSSRHSGAVGLFAYVPDHATAFDARPAADGWAARVYDWQHGHALYRQDDRLVLRTRAGIEYGYALPAQWQYALEELVDATGLTLPVGRMADLNGNAWVFERGPDSSLTRSVEWKGEEVTGRTVECEASRGNRVESHKRLLTALTLIDADGRAHPLVGYEYDRDGNLIAALDAMSQPHHFEYDDAHRMVRHTSARGVSFYYNHQRYDDEVWRVDRAWGDNGLLAYRFVYDPVRQETHITDSLGHTTLLQYNERGIPVAQIDPLGGVTTYRYDAQWRTSAETDPAGRTTMWAYDAYGNLLAQTLPDGSALRAAEHNVDHKLVRVADTSGRQRRYTWDERRNLLGELPPTQASSQYCYDAHGQVVSHTGPCGAVTRFLYDHDGNLAEVIDAVGHRTRYTHDARANLIQTVNALGQMSQYEYDRNGNLTRAIEPGGSEFFCSYDADGNLTRYRDPNGRVTQLEYSPLGQITRRLTPDGNAVEYRYDTEGQLIAVVNERGELYQLKRDALGRIVEEIDYWGQPRRYVYGAEGELLRSIDPLGQAIDYDTDVLGRIVKKRVPDLRQPDGIRTETFSYDPHGNLIVAENPDCRVELKYDSTGRVVEERQGDDFVIVHVYNAVGNRIERRTELKAGGEIITHTVRYEYDALDVVSSIQIDDAAPVTFDRNALGQIRVEHLGEELRRELSYTSEGLLAKQSLLAGTGPLFVSDYAYNANEEMTEKRDWRLGCARYEYNPVGKLITHLDPAGKLHRFLYDPAGDLLKTWIRQGHPYDREPQTDTWIREGDYEGCRYAFDRVGNLVRKQDQQQDLMLSWDGDGLLIETLTVRQVRGGEECSSGTLSIHTRYGYDAFHRRTKKITTILQETDSQTRSNSEWTAPSRTSCFFWDAAVLAGEFRRGDRYADRLLDCSSGAGMARSNTFISPTGLTNVRSQSPDEYGEARAWFYYPGSFVPLAGMRHACAPASPVGDVLAFGHVINDEGTSAIKRPQVPHEDRDDRALFAIRLPSDPTSEPSTLSYFHTDPNGTPMRITDSQGAVMWESIYEAWGNCVHIEIGIRFDQPLRSLGQYFDTESGLHYNLFRYFDPKAAQFINQDPIGIIGGCNVYQYAHNFIGWVDPLGLSGKRNRNSPPPFNPGDLRSINRWLVRAAQRGLREGGDNWQKAQNMFVKYAIRINERLIQAGSDYRLRYELAVNSAGEQVKPSETGSRRLEIVVENTKTGKYVSGVDVSLNPKKEEKIKEKLIKEGVLTEEDELMSVNSYYREFFEKQWPGFKVFDIRSMYMDHCTRTRKIVPGWMAEED